MVKFGVAGYPINYSHSVYKKDRLKIFKWLRSLDLDAFEAQMTYGPKTTVENCLEIKRLSNEFGIKVSIHAAYYIVLTSDDKDKVRRSIETLKKTYELADLMGADVVVLHPGPYYGKNEYEIRQNLIDNLEVFFKEIGKTSIGLFLETAGKKGQLGSVDEVISISKLFDGCYPCFDFGHIHARTGGTLDSTASIVDLIHTLKLKGVFDKDQRVHFHYTPIHYGPKGEISHKAIDDTIPPKSQLDFFTEIQEEYYHPRYDSVIDSLRDINSSFTIISETHNTQEIGAMKMKQHYFKSVYAL